MRKIFLLFAFACLCLCVHAQNLIAVEHSGVSTFYTTFDSAYNAAQDGDNVYLPGGYFSAAKPINKKLFIYGSGFNTDSSTATGITSFSSTLEISPLASGGTITGIYTNNGYLSIHDTVNNYTISRCFFGTISIGTGAVVTPASNINIIETVMTGQLVGNCSASTYPKNVVVLNSFIGSTNVASCITAGNVWQGLTCHNCILFGSTYCNFGCTSFLSNIRYSSFENCIIMDFGQGYFGGDFNTYTNCLLNRSTDYIGSDNSVSNCIFNQDTSHTFISAKGTTYDIHNNYHLKTTSPGHNAGSDGNDIGLYGGTSPWKDGSMPSNPHIISKNISGSTDTNGNLSVNIKVEAQKN